MKEVIYFIKKTIEYLTKHFAGILYSMNEKLNTLVLKIYSLIHDMVTVGELFKHADGLLITAHNFKYS